jgi:hypothetical protein
MACGCQLLRTGALELIDRFRSIRVFGKLPKNRLSGKLKTNYPKSPNCGKLARTSPQMNVLTAIPVYGQVNNFRVADHAFPMRIGHNKCEMAIKPIA